MNYSRTIVSIALALSLSFLLSGCGEVSHQTTPEITPENTITTDCIASYYRQGQAPYITQQQHQFAPTSGSLKITANEPDDRFQFALNKDTFSQSKPLTDFLSALPAEFVNQPLAAGVFYSFVAGSGLLPTESLTTGELFKLEGQWYEPLQTAWPKRNFQVILLKNMATNRIDSVGINQFKNGLTPDAMQLKPSETIEQRWLIRSYNLRYNKALNTLVPRTIDIFDMTEGIASKKRIIQFEYKSVR